MTTINTIMHTYRNRVLTLFNLKEACNIGTIELNTDTEKQQFGDLNANTALVLAKKLHQSPRDLAYTIQKSFSHPLIEKIEVVNPGFINLFLTQEAFHNIAQELLTHKSDYFKTKPQKKDTISIEFVSANPTGPLHLGHGRGGIIGDVLGNILLFQGHAVAKEYYINDAGAQIAKLGNSFQMRCLQLLKKEIAFPEDGYHGVYLIELAQKCVAAYSESLLDKPHEFFENYAQKALLQIIQRTLSEYGIHFDVWFSEKSLHDKNLITQAITQLSNHGYIYKKEGALWFQSTAFGDDKDRVIRKANGELTYFASDVAYLIDKHMRGHHKLIIILGQDHHSYAVRLKGMHTALGYKSENLAIILYQLVTIKENGEQLRMSKRAGTFVTLKEIIDTVGKDVARFFYLHRKADAHLDFDIELALKKTEENPVYYVQYAFVRTHSILKKAQSHFNTTTTDYIVTLSYNNMERLLIKKIAALKTILHTISVTHQTHILTYYALELAQLFHAYYAQNKIIDIDDKKTSTLRLHLVHIIHDTFALCLDLLGISKPTHM